MNHLICKDNIDSGEGNEAKHHAAVRAVLVVTAQPETRETRHMEWYQQCYAEAEKGNGY